MKVPNKPKSLLKKDVRLEYTRSKAKEYVQRLMNRGDNSMSKTQAMREAIKAFRINEMQELELRRMFD